MEKKHKGAHSELIACAYLLHEGYEVFRNVSQLSTPATGAPAVVMNEWLSCVIGGVTYYIPACV